MWIYGKIFATHQFHTWPRQFPSGHKIKTKICHIQNNVIIVDFKKQNKSIKSRSTDNNLITHNGINNNLINYLLCWWFATGILNSITGANFYHQLLENVDIFRNQITHPPLLIVKRSIEKLINIHIRLFGSNLYKIQDVIRLIIEN